MNVTASLQIKRNIYQVVLSYKDMNGERKQKWISTSISAKGNTKRLANVKVNIKLIKKYKIELIKKFNIVFPENAII